MRTIIEIANLTKKKIDSEYVQKIVRKTAKLSGVNLSFLELSVVFVNKPEMKKINSKYKGKKKSTDVLSFRFDSGYNKKGIKYGKDYIGGEIILCPDVIQKDARENRVAFLRELTYVLSHGVLHVLGYRHGVKMFQLQDKICE